MSAQRICLIMLTMVAIAIPLMAQEEEKPPPMVAENYFIVANPGQWSEFENALKGHFEWHASKNDTWYWHTWQIATGENLGQYIIRTGNHTWADFDEYPLRKEDGAHYMENVAQYVKEISMNIVVALPEISNWPDDLGMPAMVDVNVYQIDRAYRRSTYSAIKKIHEAIIEKEMPFPYAWSYVASGDKGAGLTWILAIPFNSWSEYGEMGKGLDKIVEEVYGDYERDVIFKLWNKSVAHSENFVAAYRADLSYNPPE